MEHIRPAAPEGDATSVKMAFIRPPDPELISRKQKLYNRRWPPLALLNCAAIARSNGCDVVLEDLQDCADFLWTDRIRDVDMAFVTTSSIDRWQCPKTDISDYLDFVRRITREAPVILMGVHGTLAPEWILKESGALAVIKGEPEGVVEKISAGSNYKSLSGISFREGESIHHNAESSPFDLSSLPLPAYDMVKMEQYRYELSGGRMALIETSRGCPFQCSFCGKDIMYGKSVRHKTREQICAEIELCVCEKKCRSIYFFDLEFGVNPETIDTVCGAMKDYKTRVKWCCQTRLDLLNVDNLKLMKDSGCSLIHFGVESGTANIRADINKDIDSLGLTQRVESCRKLGIETAGFFLLGFRNETQKQMCDTISFACKLNPSYASFHAVTDYTAGNIIKATEQRDHTLAYEESKLESGELDRLISGAFRQFYLRFEYLSGRLLRQKPDSIIKLLRLFRGYIS